MRYALLLLFFISLAAKADYIWTYSGVSAPTPLERCVMRTSDTNYNYDNHHVTFNSPTEALCRARATRKSNGTIYNESLLLFSPITRSGTCDLPKIHMPLTGACELPPNQCADTAGLTEYHLAPTGKTRTAVGEPWNPPGDVTGPPAICARNCRFNLANSNGVSCGSLKNGDPLAQFCLFKYTGAGEGCGGSDPNQYTGPIAPVPPIDPKDPTDPANNCGPKYVWSGTTCVPKFEDEDPNPDPENPGDGGSDGGGNNGGGSGGGSGGGDGNGGGDGSGDGSGGGSGGGTGGGDGDSNGGGNGEGLEQGQQGNFAEGIQEWDEKIEEAREALDQKLDQYSQLFKGVFDLNLGSGSGSLPCEHIPVSFGRTSASLNMCLEDYSDQLSYLRFAILLAAAALAAFIILR
jgi:hypothetical protein